MLRELFPPLKPWLTIKAFTKHQQHNATTLHQKHHTKTGDGLGMRGFPLPFPVISADSLLILKIPFIPSIPLYTRTISSLSQQNFNPVRQVNISVATSCSLLSFFLH